MTVPQSDSRVLTLVFTDLADSTALKTERGDVAVAELIGRHRDQVRQLADECSGRIIDWAGDGCFLTFETSSAGVLFSLRLQRTHSDDSGLPGVRVGVHVGEVSESAGPQGPDGPPRIDGLAVDVAARIQGLAKPGQVLMSTAVYNSAKQRIGNETMGMRIAWQLHGTYVLKGYDAPLDIAEAGIEGVSSFDAPRGGDKARLLRRARKQPEVYKESNDRGVPIWAFSVIVMALAFVIGYLFVQLDRRSVASPIELVAPAADPITSLAVLPLDNLMNDAEQDYFVDGMTEAITAELAKISALKVISRTSAMTYKGTAKKATEIASELGVRGLIEGSVLREGDNVRITVQLIDARDDTHVWAETYDNSLRNIFELQREVALAIAREVHASVTPSETNRIAASREVDPAAHEAFLKGMHFYNQTTRESHYAAIGFLEEATELDPNFARAWAELANTYSDSVLWGYTSPEVYPAARQAAERALELDDTLAVGHTALGYIRYNLDWDWRGAESEFERAIALAPSDGMVRFNHAWFLALWGRTDEAIQSIEDGLARDPLSLVLHWTAGQVYNYARQPEATLRVAEEALRLDDAYGAALGVRGEALWLLGRYGEAIEVLRRTAELLDDPPSTVSNLALAHIGAGDRAAARALLAEMEQNRRPEVLSDVPIALVHAALGQRAQAFALLESAFQARDWWVLTLRVDPKWDCLRDDPRFWGLIDRIGFPPLPLHNPVAVRERSYRELATPLEFDRIERIAVLPFANISGDVEQEWFVDGMTEALTMELAKIGALTVVSRTSAMQYKNVIRPMQDIAGELGVDALIEGSVMRAGESVRITAQLIDGRSDTHLWADRYDGTMNDLFGLQSKVALAIAKEIDVALTPQEESAIARDRAISAEAQEAYLRGRHLWNRRTKADMLRSIEYFERAVSAEPDFAEAHAAVADAYNLLAIYHYLPAEETFQKAIDAAERALAIDDTLADAHTSLAYSYGSGMNELARAREGFERALELNPKHVQTHVWYAATLMLLNRPAEALTYIDRALALDPLLPVSTAVKVGILYYSGRVDEAVTLGRHSREVNPNGVPLLLWLGMTLIDAGYHEEGIEAYERLAELSDRHPGFLGFLGLAYGRAGRREDALALIEEISANPISEAMDAYHVAQVYFGLGEVDRTLDLLEQSLEERHRGHGELVSSTVWNPLRELPRFQAIVERIGIQAPE